MQVKVPGKQYRVEPTDSEGSIVERIADVLLKYSRSLPRVESFGEASHGEQNQIATIVFELIALDIGIKGVPDAKEIAKRPPTMSRVIEDPDSEKGRIETARDKRIKDRLAAAEERKAKEEVVREVVRVDKAKARAERVKLAEEQKKIAESDRLEARAHRLRRKAEALDAERSAASVDDVRPTRKKTSTVKPSTKKGLFSGGSA